MKFIDKLEALVQLILEDEFNEKEQKEIDDFFNEVYGTYEIALDSQPQPPSLPEAQVQFQSAPEAQVQFQSAPEAQVLFQSAPEAQVLFQSAPEAQALFQLVPVEPVQYQSLPELQPHFELVSYQTELLNVTAPTPVTQPVSQPPRKRKRSSVTERVRPPSTRIKKRKCSACSEPESERSSPIKRRTRHPISLKKQLMANKHARNKGEAYSNFYGKPMPPREQGPPCGSSCRFKCAERIEPAYREAIFHEFWSMADHKAQWDFIAQNMSVTPKVQCTTLDPSKRLNTRKYSFDVGGMRERICRPMFLNTLGISNQWVATVCKKLDQNGFVSDDGRGKRNRKKPCA